jgi:hypothetical protein
MQTLYANVVNLKVTPTEVVLEFSNFFPPQPQPAPPPNLQPDIRIVLSPASLPGLAAGFAQAVQQQRAAVAAAAQRGPVN